MARSYDCRAALIEFFKRMRPGDPATLENAREFLGRPSSLTSAIMILERVGRYKLNQKLDLEIPIRHTATITKWDIVQLVRRMILINNGVEISLMILIISATAGLRRLAS